ncbi:hypothetical protein BCR43DRAFT_293109 [Syncephalastrum racemosum]|uniref:Uncharacterized protein n=1 Tax=Syncephalastrum racemosum TaxID=13706 RepID=A0A1X2HDN8_SYNRA|nr:hypothetical protein BCR43DRAFT_293109 [Syncephalastrum racemosum]
MAELLNKDWLQYPWLRCCTSQLLAGLVEGTTAVIINTVEPYCRDTMLDAHHERRVFGGPTSFPSTPNRYGFLSISKLSTSDGPVTHYHRTRDFSSELPLSYLVQTGRTTARKRCSSKTGSNSRSSCSRSSNMPRSLPCQASPLSADLKTLR